MLDETNGLRSLVHSSLGAMVIQEDAYASECIRLSYPSARIPVAPPRSRRFNGFQVIYNGHLPPTATVANTK